MDSKIIKLLLFFLLPINLYATEFQGSFKQGSFILGKTHSNSKVFIDDKKVNRINEGKQIIGLSGSTLYDLEKKLEPLEREPHSIIGSTSIGASIIGGVCNNSGGSLVKRGPASVSYTHLTLPTNREV